MLLVALLCATPATPAAAQASFTFKRIAAVGDAAPGGGEYREFLGAPSLDRGQVAFRSVAVEEPDGRLGVFRSDKTGGGVATVVDTLTLIPGGNGPFTGFGTLSLDGGKLAVIGFGTDPSSGVYLANGPGGLAEIARAGTVLDEENRLVRLNDFFDLSLSQGKVAFLADTQIEDIITFSVVHGDGTLLALLTSGFPLDPTTCCVSLDDDQAVFSAQNPVGVFSAAGGAVSVIADPGTTIADSLFTALDRPAVHKGQTVFVAASLSRQGVFLHADSSFAVIADTATLVPGGGGTAFFSFDQPSIHGGAVAFLGCAVTGCGVYTTVGGALAKVVAPGDTLDGKTVTDLEVGREAISCSSVAFRAAFSDGTQGIYRADLLGGAPCPTGLDGVTALTVWGGLKTSDDQGTAFDVRAEVRVNGILVAEGETHCITGLTRNPSRARPIEVAFQSFPPPETEEGDDLSLTVLARIGTDGAGSRCNGPGATHASATGLRVYFDSVFRPSGFGVGLDGETARSLQLDADGAPCLTGPTAPGAILSLDRAAPAALLAKCADSSGVSYKGGNPWKEIGTWTTSLPGEGGFAEGAPDRQRGRWRRP